MLIGQQIGPFEIEKELGSGAMGTVYRAKFNKGDKVVSVALKVIALGLLGNEGAMARFEREANILKQLKHPHIVRLIATGRYRQTPFIAMEYIDGESLDRTLARRGRLGWEEIVAYGKHLCEALQNAHEKGIIHRDLKPSNLMIARDGVLKLTDFGIAKDTDVTALTGMNSTIGTAAYMSPEQCKGDKNLTHKSDLYSLGVVFFELLTGKKPFQAESTVDMFLKHVNEQPPRIGKLVQDLPQKLEALILQLLEKDKEDRPMDASWVGRMLGEVEEDAFTRKSAGLEAASARRGDRPRSAASRPIDEADREAARALKGVKKKKKKKLLVPWHERKWVRATGIVAVLLAMAAGVYLLVRPPSAEKLTAAIEAAKTPDAKLAAAEEYLRKYGDKSGEATDKAAAAFREGKVREREKQLVNRFGNPKMREEPEGDDPDAYRDAMLALSAEKAGNLKLAADLWTKVKGRFVDEAKIPFTFDDQKLAQARWAWVADKRMKDIESVATLTRQLGTRIDENRRFEKGTPFDATNPESLAVKALRLERVQDSEKAARLWDSVVSLTEKDPGQHLWFLLASANRAQASKASPETASGTRLKWVQGRIAEIEAKRKALAQAPGDAGDRIALRGLCRELVELYDDEVPDAIAKAVARAKQVLDDTKEVRG